MNIERRALIDGPFGYRAAVGLAIGSVGEQPLNERQAETGDAIVGGKAQRDFAACPVIGNPAQGTGNWHAMSFRESNAWVRCGQVMGARLAYPSWPRRGTQGRTNSGGV